MKKIMALCFLLLFSGCGKFHWPDLPWVEYKPPLPLGLIDFKITVPENGVVNPKICFSTTLPRDAKWVVHDVNNGYYDIPCTLSPNRKTIIINLEDGGTGDLLAKPDGMVYHVGGPSYEEPPKIVA